MDNEFNGYVQQVADLVEKRENYQRFLGQVSSTVNELYGKEALLKLADEVEETTGRKISYTTLRNYKWVWERTCSLDLPEDLSYRCLQTIAGSDTPEKYADLIREKGYSSAEIIRLIREEKGLPNEKKKTYLCKECGAENEI